MFTTVILDGSVGIAGIVVTLNEFDGALSPPVERADTVKEYIVFGDNPSIANDPGLIDVVNALLFAYNV